MDIQALQQLRIVERDRISPFEWDDGTRVEFSLDGPGILRDPLLVTPLDDDYFLLLDDPCTFYSLGDADLEHLPVQICPPVQLTLGSEPLNLTRFTHNDLVRTITRFADRVELLPADQPTPPSPDYLDLTFSFIGAPAVRIRIRHSSRCGCPIPFEALFRAILDNGGYYPAVHDEGEEDWVGDSGPHSGAVCLPTFCLEDLRLAVTSERLFPPGLIRVQAAHRVFNIDFPIPVLTDQSSLDEKQLFLTELIALRARRRRIARYDGRVYMLNR